MQIFIHRKKSRMFYKLGSDCFVFTLRGHSSRIGMPCPIKADVLRSEFIAVEEATYPSEGYVEVTSEQLLKIM